MGTYDDATKFLRVRVDRRRPVHWRAASCTLTLHPDSAPLVPHSGCRPAARCVAGAEWLWLFAKWSKPRFFCHRKKYELHIQ